MQQYLQQDIQFLPGVGPKRADLLREELNISTIEDLLTYYPYRYVDRSRFYKISEASTDMPFIQIRGKILGYAAVGKGRGKRLTANFQDESGQIQLVINTSVGGETRRDGYYIRRNALKYKIPYATTLAGGLAFYTAIQALKKSELTVKALQEYVV